jgi:hypothetical protein
VSSEQWSARIVVMSRCGKDEQDETEHSQLNADFLGLEPDGRRPWIEQAVKLRKGIRDFYGEGKI